MECDKCNRKIGKRFTAYRVQVLAVAENGEDYDADDDVGFFCGRCLSKGV